MTVAESNIQLSAEVISVATELEWLNETLKKWVVDSALQKKYEEVMAKTKALVDKLPAWQEQQLSDEARTRLHALQEALKTTEEDLTKLAKEVDAKGGEKNNREKAKDMIDKYKTPVALAGAAVTGGYGLLSGFSEGRKEGKGIGKLFKALWRGIKGFFKWARARWAARVWATAVSMWIDKFADLSKLNPINRAKDAAAAIGVSITWLLAKITGNKAEVYDPGNQATEEARLQDGVVEMRFDELNRPVLVSDSKKTSDVVALPEEINLPAALQQAVLDDRFKDPTFTDKYLLTVRTANIWTQAARKRIPSTMNPLNDDGGDYNSLWLIEQDILALQKLVIAPATTKTQLTAATTALLNNIQTFENDRTNVIWGGDRKKLVGNIEGHTAWSGATRETTYTTTEVKVLNHMRSVGGYGDSDVVAHALMDDLFTQERYAPVLTLFEDEHFLGEVERASLTNSDFDTGLNAYLMKFFGQHNLLTNGSTKGLSPEAVATLAKELLKQHRATKARFDEKNHSNGLQQIKQHFTRSFGDIDTDAKAQTRMVEAYEKQFGASTLTEYAKTKKGVTEYTANKFEIVKDFARDLAKEQAYKWSMIQWFGMLFFDHFLGATAKKQVTVGGGVIQSFTDPQEGLLADIVGAGSDVSDRTASMCVDIGINLAISLIPMVGTNMIVARVASSIAGATMKASLTRLGVSVLVGGVVGHVAHTTMNALIGNHKWGNFSETIKNYFGSLLDRNEFAKNTLFYGLLTWLGPFLKSLNVAQLSKATRMSPELLTKLGSGFWGKFLTNSGIAGAETALLEWSKLAFDPDYEWSRWDVVTTFMLALAMNSMQKAAVGKEKEVPALQATKWKDGKVSLKFGKKQLKPLTKLAHQIDAKGDVATTLATHIEHGTVFTHGANKIKLSQEGGAVSVMKQNAKGLREKLDAAGIHTLTANKHELIIQNMSQKLMAKLSNSPTSMNGVLEKAKINSGDFMERCRTHEVWFLEKHTVGDFFKLIGEKRFGKLLFGGRKSAPNETISYLEGRKSKALRNSHMAFNLWSLVYGMQAGDGNEAGGLDEGLENYLLYGVVGRTIPGKIIMAMIDSSDIVF